MPSAHAHAQWNVHKRLLHTVGRTTTPKSTQREECAKSATLPLQQGSVRLRSHPVTHIRGLCTDTHTNTNDSRTDYHRDRRRRRGGEYAGAFVRDARCVRKANGAHEYNGDHSCVRLVARLSSFLEKMLGRFFSSLHRGLLVYYCMYSICIIHTRGADNFALLNMLAGWLAGWLGSVVALVVFVAGPPWSMSLLLCSRLYRSGCVSVVGSSGLFARSLLDYDNVCT